MPKYSQKRKDAVLKKLLAPNNYSVAALLSIITAMGPVGFHLKGHFIFTLMEPPWFRKLRKSSIRLRLF